MNTAGHDITVGSAVTFMERHAKRLDESSTTNHGSAVAVGGNLTMTAGNDSSVLYSFVHAEGNALDISNWKKNWDTYIKHSFEVRRLNKNGEK